MICHARYVNILMLVASLGYVMNPYVPKSKQVVEFVNNKLVKIVWLIVAYFIAVHFSFLLAFQLVAGFYFIEFDYTNVLKQLSLAKNM